MAFTGTVRILMQLNSCINPIIYASTIPAYKELVRGLFTCNVNKRMSEMEIKEIPSTTFPNTNNTKDEVPKSSENNI